MASGTKSKIKTKKTVTKKQEIQDEQNKKIKCTSCLKTKAAVNYYVSKSRLYKGYGKLPICKDCLDDEFRITLREADHNEDKALYNMCMRLDYPFINSLLGGVKQQSEKLNSPIHRVYIQKINSMGEANNYGQVFLDGEIYIPKITKKQREKQEAEDYHNEITMVGVNERHSIFDDLEVDAELVFKWGDIPHKDIIFLENEYQEWASRYDISSRSLEILLKEVCHQQLVIQKKRINGQPVDKELKTLQDLIGTMGLKPIQESAAQATDTQTFGTLIKKWENEKPIPEAQEEFKDVDGIKKYITVWFFGHLCRMMGIDNDYSRQYDEELMANTVNLPENSFTELDDLDGDANVDE